MDREFTDVYPNTESGIHGESKRRWIIWHGLFGNVFTTYLLFTNAQKSTPETLQPGRDLSSNIGQGLLFPTQGGQGSFWHNTIRCDQ
jgi:hypothetical protein